MARHPARFEFDFAAVPFPGGVEAAARRRMRGIETCHPGIREWQLRMAGPDATPVAEGGFSATLAAGIAGGERLRADGQGSDPFAALRLAFERLERQLDTHHDGVRQRVRQWLGTVRQRMAHRHSHE